MKTFSNTLAIPKKVRIALWGGMALWLASIQNLLEGDPAANNGGWQWTAGTGADAAPYFRMFNPVLQGVKLDLQGVYVRRWVSELKNVPFEFIHTPWEISLDQQERFGCIIRKDYPTLLMDHTLARERMLTTYNEQ